MEKNTEEIKKIDNKEKKQLRISIIYFILASCLSLLLVKGLEGQFLIFNIIEFFGKYATKDKVWNVAYIVIFAIIFLLLMHRKNMKLLKEYPKKYKVVKFLTTLMLIYAMLIYLVAGNIPKAVMGLQQGLDTVVYENRMDKAIWYDAKEGTTISDPLFGVKLINYGRKTVSFNVKLVKADNKEKFYIYNDNKGNAINITIKPGEFWVMGFKLKNIDPEYKNGDKVPLYNVVIYNEKESHTFLIYR